MKNRNCSPANVLLIEDSVLDIKMTQEAFLEGKIKNHLHIVNDGEEALDFLHRRGDHSNAPRPDLILLDLNLPRTDGREVLAEMKSHHDLRRIPVVILTTSKADDDVFQAYDLHVNCYVKKPIDANQFLDTIKSIKNFWLNVVDLPANS